MINGKCIIVFNSEKKHAEKLLDDVDSFLNNDRSIQTVIYRYCQSEGDENSSKKLPEEILKNLDSTDFIISIGGDGTLLYTARLFAPAGLPIIGVNVGKLGFITEASGDELKEEIMGFLNGENQISERMMLEAVIFRKGKHLSSFYALNDIVIGKNSLSRISKIETSINGNYICTYEADGLVVSTPTGSTAYNLSAGGPIMHPGIHAMILTPICNHSLRVRPLVISDTSHVKARLLSRYPNERLVADGQEWAGLEYEDEIFIKKSPFSVKMVKSSRRDFFEILKTKLHWID